MADQFSPKRRRATIHDVAVHAQVSISTVSHVINNTASISQETRQKIWKAIEELDYTPNVMARELRQKHSNLMGIIVPDIANEFYAQCASGLLAQTDPDRNTAMICDTGYNLRRERRQVETLIERRVAGLVFFGGINTDAALLAKRAGVRVVLGDWTAEGFHSVEFDNATSFRKLLARMAAKGMVRVGYISESPDLYNVRRRHEGYLQGIRETGLTLDPKWVILDRRLQMNKLQNAVLLTQELLRDNKPSDLPDAFLTSNDLIAFGVMEAMLEQGIRVPQDIGVTGVDDNSFARHFHPTLTTVRQNGYEMGSLCFQLLQQQSGEILGERHINLDCELVMRESVLL